MRPIFRLAFASFLVTAASLPAMAADKKASATETKRVQETIAKIGCKADEVEKERDDIFEVDDAQCEIGQYDIKLDSQYRITSITRD